MANQQREYRVNKRFVSKCKSRIDENITDAVTHDILHTAEDRQTLVRAIIQLDVVNLADAVTEYGIAICVNPGGSVVANASVTPVLDGVPKSQELWNYMGKFSGESAETNHIEVDLKSMRKLVKDDEIELSHVADLPNSQMICGMITLFFKEV